MSIWRWKTLLDLSDDLAKVVDYGVIEGKIRAILAEGHVNLIETLAERIASACFEDARVRTARVRVEKLHALSAAESRRAWKSSAPANI